MKRCIRISAVLLAAVTALTLAVVSPERESWGNGEIPLDDAEVFFELNNTDGDLGIHSLIDGEPWKKLVMEDPYEREILRIRLRGRLKEQGLTELFFERAEPNFGDLDPVDFFLRFPEGGYEIEGTTLDGAELEGEAEVTHRLPEPPGNVMINTEDAAEDCDADPLPSVSAPVTISWEAVTLSHPDLGRTNEPIVVVQYEVVVEQEDLGLAMSVELPPGVTEIEIPEAFIELGDEFKFEILVREDSGNQTAVESCFEVED